MTPPRLVAPNVTYLLTRRCSQRRFRLVPRAHTNQHFAYCLAVCAQKHHIQAHAVAVLSNHYHAVLTDTRGSISDFMRDFHSLLGRGLNAKAGLWESFWAPQGCSLVRLVDRADVAAKTAYCLANPVSSHLVAKHEQWPGFITPMSWLGGQGKTFTRPVGFFRDSGAMPEQATLTLTVPPAFAHEPCQQFIDTVNTEVRAIEAQTAAERQRSGAKVLGIMGVRKQKKTSSPKTREPRRGLDPAIAAKNTTSRVRELAALVAFRTAYRVALAAWRGGDRAVIFPCGTFQMVRLHGAQVHSTPPAAPILT